MMTPLEHARAIWSGNSSPESLAAAIAAHNEEAIAENERLRSELSKAIKPETALLLQKAVEAQCEATKRERDALKEQIELTKEACAKASAYLKENVKLRDNQTRSAAMHETTKSALLSRIYALTEERDRLNDDLFSVRRGQTVCFDVQHFGEKEAGLRPWSDVVTINVRDGAIDGLEGEFVECIQPALVEFFDGAAVTVATDPTKE